MDNKKEQMDMLTKNMKQLISEVKREMRKERPTGFDLNDPIPSPIRTKIISRGNSAGGSKRTGISIDKKNSLPDLVSLT